MERPTSPGNKTEKKVLESVSVDKCNQEKTRIRLLEREKPGEGMEQRGHVWLPKNLARSMR